MSILTRGGNIPIDSIQIEPSAVMPTQRVLHIDCGGYKFEGYFDDLPAFFRAVYGAMAYYGQVSGQIKLQNGKVVSTK